MLADEFAKFGFIGPGHLTNFIPGGEDEECRHRLDGRRDKKFTLARRRNRMRKNSTTGIIYYVHCSTLVKSTSTVGQQ